VAQRIDVEVTMPKGGGAIPVLAHVEGSLLRAGIVLATKGAQVRKIDVRSPEKGPRDTLELEKRLRSQSPLGPRRPDRSFTVDLTGTMQGYVWNMATQGQAGMPVSARKGERVEVEMRNLTPMAHPMHLHGHVFQVVAIDGKRFGGAVRDTVLVPPKSAVTFAFDADNPGLWAFHCHNLYHLAAGMFTTMVYRNIG
jgi:FtsP/CotA-like multicopper oxidase with cupredoxin domain